MQRWNPWDPDSALSVLETWDTVVPKQMMHEIHQSVVLPKLRAAIDEWVPNLAGDQKIKSKAPPLHVWLHPWLPRLGDTLHELHAPIRHKLSSALQEWHTSDTSALDLLKPWRRVFAVKDWDALLTRSVIPKLEHMLVAELQIDRNCDSSFIQFGEGTAPLRDVLAWEALLPQRRVVGLLETKFFPRWLAVLHLWLTDPDPSQRDLESITKWYLGWKTKFSEDLLAHERIRKQINTALDMMNQASGGGGEVRSPVHASEAARDAKRAVRRAATEAWAGAKAGASKQKNRNGNATFNYMDDDSLAETISLKEVVESFASQSDVSFVPKAGRQAEGLSVWSFGKVSITIDSAKQIIRAHTDGRWAPVSLNQLLELHKKKVSQDSKAF